MKARIESSQKDDEIQSTNIINNSLQAHNQKNNDQGKKAFVLSKSYHPDKPHVWTENDLRKSAEYEKHIRYDSHNLRMINDIYDTLVYLPKDHPDYREHPEPGWQFDETEIPRISLSHIHHP